MKETIVRQKPVTETKMKNPETRRHISPKEVPMNAHAIPKTHVALALSTVVLVTLMALATLPASGACRGGPFTVSNAVVPLVAGFDTNPEHIFSAVWIYGKGNAPAMGGNGYLGNCNQAGCDSGFPFNRAMAVASPCSGNEVNPGTLLYEVSQCDFGVGSYTPGSYMMSNDWWNSLFDGCPGFNDRLVGLVQQRDGKCYLFSLLQNGGLWFELDDLGTSEGFALPTPRVVNATRKAGTISATIEIPTLPQEAIYGSSPVFDPNDLPLVMGINVYVWTGKGAPPTQEVPSQGWNLVGTSSLGTDQGSGVDIIASPGTTTVSFAKAPPGLKQYIAYTLVLESGYETFFTSSPVKVASSGNITGPVR